MIYFYVCNLSCVAIIDLLFTKKTQPSYTYVKAQAQINSPDHEIKSRKKVQFCVTSFAFLKKSSRANFESCFFI